MSLEERIRQSVGHALDDVRARVEAEVRSIVQELVSSAAEEQQAAVANARDAAVAETRRGVESEIADAEARARAGVEERVLAERTAEREAITRELESRFTAETDAKLEEAAAEADRRLETALREAADRAEQALAESVAAARSSASSERADAVAGEREADLAGISRLLEAVRGLDGAASLSDVLDVLGQSAAREAGRAALMVVRGSRVQGWKLTGFGAIDTDPRRLDLALAEAGIIGVAAGGTRVVSTVAGPEGVAPAFAALPENRLGLAVPVLVGGRAVAVVYADGAANPDREVSVPSGWPEVLEILARHAGRCLEALTTQHTTKSPSPRSWVPSAAAQGPASAPGESPDPAAQAMERAQPEAAARRLARLLISEIKLYHEGRVQEGRRDRTLLARLAPEIARARSTYDTEVPATLLTRAELFQQELVATLAGGDASLLGVPA